MATALEIFKSRLENGKVVETTAPLEQYPSIQTGQTIEKFDDKELESIILRHDGDSYISLINPVIFDAEQAIETFEACIKANLADPEKALFKILNGLGYPKMKLHFSLDTPLGKQISDFMKQQPGKAGPKNTTWWKKDKLVSMEEIEVAAPKEQTDAHILPPTALKQANQELNQMKTSIWHGRHFIVIWPLVGSIGEIDSASEQDNEITSIK